MTFLPLFLPGQYGLDYTAQGAQVCMHGARMSTCSVFPWRPQLLDHVDCVIHLSRADDVTTKDGVSLTHTCSQGRMIRNAHMHKNTMQKGSTRSCIDTCVQCSRMHTFQVLTKCK